MTATGPAPVPFENGLLALGTSQTVHLVDDRAPLGVVQPLCHAGNANTARGTDAVEPTCGRCLAARDRQAKSATRPHCSCPAGGYSVDCHRGDHRQNAREGLRD